jgi:cobalt/nickel transport system permease protein
MNFTAGATIILPGSVLALMAAGLVAGWGLLAWLTRSGKRSNTNHTDRDWSIPQLGDSATTRSLFHRWDVRFKLVSLITFAFFVVAVRSLPAASAAMLMALICVPLARLPFYRALRRLLAMSGFLVMFIVIMPLTVPTQPEDTLVVFAGMEGISFNLRGAILALTICCKAFAVALLMEPLLATAPLSVTLEGLSRLGVPDKITRMIHLAHRYIFVFLEETRRMATGMKVRGFRKRTNMETLRVTGNFLGMLFVRGFERTYRVYDAMLARGYDGTFQELHRFRSSIGDWLKATFWILLGMVLLGVDRLYLGG